MKRTKNFLYLFCLFLLAVLLLIIFFNNYTTKELSESYKKSAKNQLTYAYNNLDEKSQQIELIGTSVLTDDDIRFFQTKIDSKVLSEYEYVQKLKEIKGRVKQAELSSIDINAVHIYWPKQDLLISSKSIENTKKNNWMKTITTKGVVWDNIDSNYLLTLSAPYIDSENKPMEYIVVVEMKPSYLEEIKKVTTNLEGSKALIRLPDGEFLNTSDLFDEQIINGIQVTTEEKEVEVDHRKIKILAKYNSRNRIQIVSYYDVGTFVRPIYIINLITAFATIFVLLLGLMLMYLFYRHILANLELLIRKFRQVENGDLTTIVTTEKSTQEFQYVFDQFNQMVSGVRRLLLSLNNEYQRHDLAERKQLQSQINPHFLYNSLFYITSVAENSEAVKAMCTHLAEYYRYQTKTKELVYLEEELNFAQSYLEIIAMRKSIRYSIQCEEELLDELLLPLLIQPLIENAIEHGIEEREGAYQVHLQIKRIENHFEICIEDDGNGLSEREIIQLLEKINMPEANETTGIGLWNVNQRLINYYGDFSAIHIEKSQRFEGLKVYFWLREGR